MNTPLLSGLLAGLAVAAAFAGATPAQAQRVSNIKGEKLVQICSSKDAKLIEACHAYIDGVADAVQFYQRMRPADGSKGEKLPGYICVPAATTGVQMREAVVAWYKKHPDQAQMSATGVVLRALDQTYLCPGEQRRIQGE